MATTSIWRVKEHLGRVVAYVENPNKTTDKNTIIGNADNPESALNTVLNYVERDSATNQRKLVSGINCTPENALEEMMAVKRHFGKTGGTLAYHGYQSFAEGEVTPEQAHRIGVELANELWGEKYQVVVTTHMDKDSHIHNHFCVQTVSFVDGIKYHRTKKDYLQMRETSDRLCEKYDLSVIYEPKRKGMNYGEWRDNRDGYFTVRGEIRNSIDYAIQCAYSVGEFIRNMDIMGYEIDLERTYPRIRHIGSERWCRFKSLGDGYDLEEIEYRIGIFDRDVFSLNTPQEDLRFVLGGREYRLKDLSLDRQMLVYDVLIGHIEEHPEANIQAYLLTLNDRQILQRWQRKLRICAEYSPKTAHDVREIKRNLSTKYENLESERHDRDNELRRAKYAGDAGQLSRIQFEISQLNQRMKFLREDLRGCDELIEDAKPMKEKLWQIENRIYRASEIKIIREKDPDFADYDKPKNYKERTR